MRALAVGLLCAGALVSAEEPRAERHLSPPGDLSPAVRQLLHERMARHGRTMSALVQSVIVLDWNESSRLAREIVEEPRLARPISKDASELNSALPERFFQLQDELRERAQRLGDLARARNGAELPKAFGQLTETCVSCHRIYSMGRAQ
jgi:cytochrome c556